MSSTVKDFLRWVFGGEGARAVDLAEVGFERSQDATISAFAIALERQFGEDVNEEAARNLIARIGQRWIKPEELKPVLAERIILSTYGEDGLIDDVPKVEVQRIQNLVSYGILRELNLRDQDLEDFFDEVVSIMDTTDGDEA